MCYTERDISTIFKGINWLQYFLQVLIKIDLIQTILEYMTYRNREAVRKYIEPQVLFVQFSSVLSKFFNIYYSCFRRSLVKKCRNKSALMCGENHIINTCLISNNNMILKKKAPFKYNTCTKNNMTIWICQFLKSLYCIRYNCCV